MTESDGRSRRVHILLLGPSATPVGGYKVAYEYANALTEAGERVTVWHSTAFFAEMVDGSRVIKRAKAYVRSFLSRLSFRRGLAPWMTVHPAVTMRLTGGLPRPRVQAGDIVLATAVETVRHAARIARAGDAASVALMQHFETWAASGDQIIEAMREVDVRVVIAPWLGEILAAHGMASVLLPNAIDAGAFPLGPPLDRRGEVVLTLLSRHSYKRPDVVIAALQQIHERLPSARLVAFGQDERPTDLADYVQYTRDPAPPELRSLYQQATVYMCGSDAEGWHLPPAEATLSGASVVSTDIGGVRVSMESDALYAPTGDAARLAELVVVALRQRAESQERADRARERLVARTLKGNALLLSQAFDRARGKE